MQMFITYKQAQNFSFEPYKDCPCESGKKYKFCCYKKGKDMGAKELNLNAKRILFESKKSFRETDFETCFAFQKNDSCKNVIGAHSLQNNGVLDKITTDNHLYYLDTNVDGRERITLKFEKVGKNIASKFSGFCKNHDKEYFSIIEDIEYENTEVQNYWFAFRAFCFEFHRKKRLRKSLVKLFKSYPHATRHPSILTSFRSCELDLRDKNLEYERFKEIYETGSYDRIESFVKVLPYKVAFTGTTAVAVNVDIEGNETIDIYNYDEKLFVPSVYVSVIPKETSTLIIVSRFKEDTCYKGLIDSLNRCSDEETLFKYITFCLTEFSENVYFCPEIIDCVGSIMQDRIIASFKSSLSKDVNERINTMLKSFKLNLFDLKMNI
jgi:hypothetical protein